MTTYHVTVIRQDGAWFADVDGLAPHLVGATDVPRFADLDVEVRDLIAGLTDTDPESFSPSRQVRQPVCGALRSPSAGMRRPRDGVVSG